MAVEPLGVLIVDDQAPSRRALRALVDSTAGLASLADVASAEEALDAATELKPDLVLVELTMPGLDGLETSRRLSALLPDAVVVLMSEGQAPHEDARRAAGVAAFVAKRTLSPSVLTELWNRYGRA